MVTSKSLAIVFTDRSEAGYWIFHSFCLIIRQLCSSEHPFCLRQGILKVILHAVYLHTRFSFKDKTHQPGCCVNNLSHGFRALQFISCLWQQTSLTIFEHELQMWQLQISFPQDFTSILICPVHFIMTAFAIPINFFFSPSACCSFLQLLYDHAHNVHKNACEHPCCAGCRV